jgi:hypothetical protein
MLKKGIVLWFTVLLFHTGMAAWAEEESSKRMTMKRLIAQIDSSSSVKETFKVSPDSRHVAWVARGNNRMFVIVDKKEEKPYDGIGTPPIFSPDSKHVAYVAQVGNKQFLVVDGIVRTQYDSILTLGVGRIVFDTPDSLHYLAAMGNRIYLVETRLR